MHIVDSHEFVEMYRGDKDLRLGFELCKRYGWKYTMLAPDVASPADQAFFGGRNFPIEEAKRYEWPEGFEIILLPARLFYFSKKNLSLGGFFEFCPSIMKAMKNIKPDILFENPYTTLTPRSYFTNHITKKMKIPKVYVDPADYVVKGHIKRFLNRIERKVVNRAKAVITYADIGRKRFIEDYGYPKEKIHVIPKPIDIHMFNPDVSSSEFNKKWKVEDKFRVAYFGRLSNNKGATHLVDVAHNLKREKDMVFMFVGGNITTKDGEAIISKSRKNGINNVVFTGKTPHKEMVVAQSSADIAVYPDVTNLPGFSTVLAESMAMGKAIIIGIKGYEDATPIIHKETGIIVEPRNVAEISKWVCQLKEDNALRQSIGNNARRFAEERMSWDKQIEIYREIFAHSSQGAID